MYDAHGLGVDCDSGEEPGYLKPPARAGVPDGTWQTLAGMPGYDTVNRLDSQRMVHECVEDGIRMRGPTYMRRCLQFSENANSNSCQRATASHSCVTRPGPPPSYARCSTRTGHTPSSSRTPNSDYY